MNHIQAYKELVEVFEENQASKLVKIFEMYKKDSEDRQLANLVTKDEFKELKDVVKELAEAQKRTEIRIDELAEAQKETQKEVTKLDKAMQELAEAQKKTESEVATLTKTIKFTRREIGGITDTLGFSLENLAYKNLPTLLEKDFNINVEEKLCRKYLQMESGSLQEFNIVGKGKKDGKEILILGM